MDTAHYKNIFKKCLKWTNTLWVPFSRGVEGEQGIYPECVIRCLATTLQLQQNFRIIIIIITISSSSSCCLFIIWLIIIITM